MKVHVIESEVGGGKVFIEGVKIKAPNPQAVEGIADRIWRVLGIGTTDRIHPIMENGIRKYVITLKRELTQDEFEKLIRGV